MLRPILSLLLVVAVAASGCAARTVPGVPAVPPASGDIPPAYVEQLPVGRQVEVRLKAGDRFKATYMGVEGDVVRLQRRGRLPVRPELIPLGEVAMLRLAENGGSATRAVIIGVVSGAAAFFGLLIGSIAAWAD